jgi:hypothetical protein|tara:strand:+ start:575 stop:757 length:183 start_codon:yes stop_codon:yes gene_type:complete
MTWTSEHPYNKYKLTIERRDKALKQMKDNAKTPRLKAMWAYKHAQFSGRYVCTLDRYVYD